MEDIPTGAVNKVEASKASFNGLSRSLATTDVCTQWRFINAVLYNPILALIKISFIVTLIKLEPPSIWVKSLLWTLFAVNIMFGIAGTLVALLNCRPIPKFWDRTIPGNCMNTAQYIYGTISVTIITDALVSVVPIFILFSLQMPRKTKALVVSFLSLGLVVTAIASYRLSVFVKVFSMDNPLQNESPYNVRTPLSNIEASLAAIAACGPTLKYILGLVIPVLGNKSSKTRSTTPKWHTMSPNHPTAKKPRTKSAGEDSKNPSGSVVELADALDWPLAHELNSRVIVEEENGSIRTAASTMASNSNQAPCEKPRSLV